MISVAHAQEAATTAANAAAQPGGLMSFLPMIVIIAVFYFLMIRPQMKRAKEHKAMTESLQKGDEVVTQGGIAGRIVKVGEGFVTVAISENSEVLVQRAAIQMVLPKGTLKSAV